MERYPTSPSRHPVLLAASAGAAALVALPAILASILIAGTSNVALDRELAAAYPAWLGSRVFFGVGRQLDNPEVRSHLTQQENLEDSAAGQVPGLGAATQTFLG